MFSSKEKRFFTTNSHGPVAEAYLQTGSRQGYPIEIKPKYPSDSFAWIPNKASRRTGLSTPAGTRPTDLGGCR